MTWWHPLWIHVDRTFYSLSWCLRHQEHLRDCLKCVLIGKQLSNNWALSALQVNARENIAADRRVAPMADALWSPDVWTSTMTRVLCKPGLPRKYSWNILIPAWVASQVLEKHHEISAISVSFFWLREREWACLILTFQTIVGRTFLASKISSHIFKISAPRGLEERM